MLKRPTSIKGLERFETEFKVMEENDERFFAGSRKQVSQGLRLFQTWFETTQQRDPGAATFVFRGEIRVSPGVFQVACTYCP